MPYAFASYFASTHLINALEIYREEFQPSVLLKQPYTMAGINVFVPDTHGEAEKLFTTLIRMFVGVLTGKTEALYPPAAMTVDLKEIFQHPALNQMLKYSFVGSKGSVKAHIQAFLKETQVDELIMVSTTYAIEDRIKSARLSAELMVEINDDK